MASTIKTIIKQFGGRFFRNVFTSCPAFRNVQIIVMYHRILEDNPRELHDPGLFVRAYMFELHIQELLEFFEPTPLQSVNVGKLRIGRSFAITFDDGWIDNYEIALPILKKYHVPATVFVSPALIGTESCFWFESLYNLANVAMANDIEGTFIEYFHDLVPSWSPPSLSPKHLSTLTTALKDFSGNRLDALVARAYSRLGIRPSSIRTIMDWNQLSEMGAHGITFGSHGLNHHILHSLTSDLKRKEIFKSLEILQNRGIPTIPLFSYPNGYWEAESIAMVCEAGYERALTTHLGYNTSQTHPFLLNRISLHEEISHTPDLFWFRVFQALWAGSRPHRNDINAKCVLT